MEILYDPQATMKVMGCLLNNNELIEDDQYPLNPKYFGGRLETLCYKVIYNLYQTGYRDIQNDHIVETLEIHPEQYTHFESMKGREFLQQCREIARMEEPNFEFYYLRLKKFAILREFEFFGLDVKPIYNSKETDPIRRQAMEERLNQCDPDELVNYFDKILTGITNDYLMLGGNNKGGHAGDGLRQLFEKLKESSDFGLGLNGDIFNTVVRGARLKKQYLRSCPTGVGKTRGMVANAARLGVGTYYDIFEEKWITVNEPQSTLYISSEQELDELQTIALAFVAGVDEDKILERTENIAERERIDKAFELIENGKLFFEPVGNYGLKLITVLTKRYKHTQDLQYLFFDYVHTTTALIQELSTSAKLGNWREDQMLLLLMTSLKDICNKLDIFLMTATQLNRSYKNDGKKDETMLRGAMSIGDKTDMACIMLDISPEELELVSSLQIEGIMIRQPNVVTHIYKNRRGKWSNIIIYSHLDKATGQMLDLFVLDTNNNIVKIPATRVIQKTT